MFYKLSNTAACKTIENEFGLRFKYPNLYVPALVINGLREVQLPVVTMESPSEINFAIWGLLPENYIGEWAVYQSFTNTLNKEITGIPSTYWQSGLLRPKRCLVLVTGYFISHLHEGQLYPFYVHLPNHAPFAIGGIYTVLEDGFTTVSILIGNGTNGVSLEIQNLEPKAPLVIPWEHHKNWLDRSLGSRKIQEMNQDPETPQLLAYPIGKEYINEKSSYKRMEEKPLMYRAIP
jgi:putative SOS response-associated peptidase YedK